jgi:hypothetical protein
MPVLRSSASDFTSFVGSGAITNGAAGGGGAAKVVKTSVPPKPSVVAKTSVVTIASKVSVSAAPTTVISQSSLKTSTTKRG